jgi:general stress protein CsbA
MTKWRGVLLPVVAVAVLVTAAWLSPSAIPYNMDEFVHYHALGCATAPLGRGLPAFRDGCGLYDLRLPLTTTPLPLRSYYYIGSLPVVPFYTLWRVFDDPVAARLQGALFLVLWTVLAARLLRVRWTAVALAALLFPSFATGFLVDEGPVGLPAILLLCGLLSARRSLAAERRRAAVAWAALSGFAFFLGLWTKLIVSCWAVAIALLVGAEGLRRHGSPGALIRARWPALAAAVAAFALPTLLLLASVDQDGRPYAAALRRGRLSASVTAVAERAAHLARDAVDASTLAPRNLTLPASPMDVIPKVAAAALLGLAAWRAPRRREVLLWLGASLPTLVLIASSEYAQWPHHSHYPMLLVVLGLALAVEGAGRPGRILAVAAVAALVASLGARLPHATHPVDSSPDKDELLSFVRRQGLDRETFQAHTSWGTYYIAQLFGDPARQLVYIKGLSDDARQLEEVRSLARDAGRPVLLLSSRRWERLQTPAVDEILGRPSETWRFGDWSALLYHPASAGGLPAAAATRRRQTTSRLSASNAIPGEP